MSQWLSRNRSKLEHALRMTVACLAAYACAEALGLPEAFWVTITALMVMQSNVGGTLKAALERFIGSLLGALYGSAIVHFIPHSDEWTRAGALILAVAPLSYLAAINAGFRIAPMTAIIVLLGNIGASLGPLGFAERRVLEVGLGCTVGLLVSMLVVPVRAARSVLETASKVTRLLAEQLETLADSDDIPQERLSALVTQTLQGLHGLETSVGEAARERRSRLTDLPDPEPLLWTLMRLRHDVASIRQDVGKPGQEAFEDLAAKEWRSVARTAAAHLRALADSLENRQPPEEQSEAMIQAIGAYHAAIDAMKRSTQTQNLTTENLWWLAGTGFALEQLHRDINDLSDRVRGFSKAR